MDNIKSVEENLRDVCDAFCIKGEFLGYEEITVGNVNKTYRVDVLVDGIEKNYIAQRLNTYVFKEPVNVMENIDKVTSYIRNKYPEKMSLHYHHTADRKTYFMEEDGFWRLYNFIPNKSYNTCENLNVIRNAGKAFGEFQMMLADFDANNLFDTIPDFHNTRKRYEKLKIDIKNNPCNKCEEVQKEIDWLLSVEDKACKLTDLFAQGNLPVRVTHNDTKINNVLFEKDGEDAIVVIDLDTVMPGLVGNDFGDAIRFAANSREEDSDDYENVKVRIDVFESFTDGFLSQLSNTLTKTEIDTLAISCFALTCELATRFLDDYILGSPYFKINYPEHNLVRTRCQIALAKDILSKLDEMQNIVNKCYKKYN